MAGRCRGWREGPRCSLSADPSGPLWGCCEDVVVSATYVHIVSRGAHGEIGDNIYERLREAHREVWFGSDGSGLMKSTLIRSSLFTAEQRNRWESVRDRVAREDLTPSIDLFAAGCLYGHGPLLSRLPTDPAALAAKLERERRLTLRRIGELMGEAVVLDALGRALYQVASELPGAEVLATATDELGRNGHGIARDERGERVELIFAPDAELLGTRSVLVDPDVDYAPVGAVVGWTSYVSREVVDSLPPGTPPVPRPPCCPPGSGRATLIEPGFLLSTGYFTDLAPHLENWLTSGVITKAQYDALKAQSES